MTEPSAATISVVMPARNRAATIGRALESVAAQTVPVAEVIIVDDASSDDTAQVAERFASRFARLEVIRLPVNGGAPRARNLAIARARGDWVALLDSDDAWHPEKLAKQIALTAPEVSAVFTNFRFVGGPDDGCATHVAGEVTLRDLTEENLLGGSSTALVRRTVLERVGAFDPVLPSCQDWDLWLKLARVGTLKVCAEPLTIYHVDGANRISSNARSVVAGHEAVFAKIYADADRRERRRLRAIHGLYLAQLCHALGTNYPAGAAAGRVVVFGGGRFTRTDALRYFARSLRRRFVGRTVAERS